MEVVTKQNSPSVNISRRLKKGCEIITSIYGIKTYGKKIFITKYFFLIKLKLKIGKFFLEKQLIKMKMKN